MRVASLSTLTMSRADQFGSQADGLVRPMRHDETRAIAALTGYCAPEAQIADSTLTAFVWERRRQGLGGFILFSMPRTLTHSAHDVICIEALWIASYLPRPDVEQALIDAALNRRDEPKQPLAFADTETSRRRPTGACYR